MWAVREAVAGLPAEEREIVRLQHFGGLHPRRDRRKARHADRNGQVEVVPAHKRLAAVLGHLRKNETDGVPQS